jgi:non-specific serine/threonine protein kinase
MRQTYLATAFETARNTLSRAAFNSSWTYGRDATLDEAIAIALSREDAPTAARGSHDLVTPREMQVARLLARGFSNRRIAEALVISQETAAVHVKHILAKLGFSSRAQIAAWAALQQPDLGEPASGWQIPVDESPEYPDRVISTAN